MTSFLNSLGDDDLVENEADRRRVQNEVAAQKMLREQSRYASQTPEPPAPAVRVEAAELPPGMKPTDLVFAQMMCEDEDDDLAPLQPTVAAAAPAKRAAKHVDGPSADAQLTGIVHTVGMAMGALANMSWRTLAYGETIAESADSDEDAKHVASKPERRVRPIGAKNGTRSEYAITWGKTRLFEATAGWWVREAHHDPLGYDPMMISMFVVAFAAGMLYSTFVEALLLCLLIEAFEWLTWLAVRGLSRVIAAELDACESRGIAMVYNIFSFLGGVALAKFVLYTWRGDGGRLHSLWDAQVADKHCGADAGVFLVWAPCTDTVTFIAIALLFLCTVFASYRRLYVPSVVILVLLVPFTALAATPLRRFFYTFTFTVATSLYFLVFMAKPIKDTYVWNVGISIAFYVFLYSLLVLSQTL